jgi:hypothetical protein
MIEKEKTAMSILNVRTYSHQLLISLSSSTNLKRYLQSKYNSTPAASKSDVYLPSPLE